MMDTTAALPSSTDRRGEIVAAARACFQRWGLAKTTMDDIAKEVGIARPNLYRYFPNKAAVASAVSAAESERINEYRRQRIAIDGPTAPLIEDSIVMDDTVVRSGAVIRGAIVDKNVEVKDGARLGVDPAGDAERFTVSTNGVVVVPKKGVVD